MLGYKYQIINAGTCGSDPYFNYVNLRDRLLPYNPDWVIQTISYHDLISDLALRGGWVRFKNDSTLNCINRPLWFYPAYISHLLRLFFSVAGYNLYTPHGTSDAVERRVLHDLDTLMQQYTNLAKKNNIKILFVIIPMNNEVAEKAYNLPITHILKKYADNHTIFCLSLLEDFLNEKKSKHSELIWKQDGHYTPYGYYIFAKAVAEKILHYEKQQYRNTFN